MDQLIERVTEIIQERDNFIKFDVVNIIHAPDSTDHGYITFNLKLSSKIGDNNYMFTLSLDSLKDNNYAYKRFNNLFENSFFISDTQNYVELEVQTINVTEKKLALELAYQIIDEKDIYLNMLPNELKIEIM